MSRTVFAQTVKTDAILPLTENGPITIGGITVLNGAITTTAPSPRSTDPAITALGVDNTDAYALTKELNVIDGGAANTGVKLPTAVVGIAVTVANITASAKKVYPFAADGIDDETVTTGALTLAPEQVVTFHCYTTAKWQSDIEDTQALATAYAAHAAATEAHGATGAVMGTTNVQEVSGKTMDLAKLKVHTGITAFATGGQASAVLLLGMQNNVTTCATAGDSVKVQPAAAGGFQIVKNGGAATLEVFPSTGDAINGGSVDASVNIEPGDSRIFWAIDGTNFNSILLPKEGTLFGGLMVDYLQNRTPLGTPSAGVTAYQFGDGLDVVTILSFEDLSVGAPTAGASHAIGVQIFEFPTGMHHVQCMSSGIELTGITGVTTDTPEVGIGSVIASGAVAVLGGTPEFEDYMTGVAAVNVAGSPKLSIYVPASSIAVSDNATEKSMFLNFADAWDAGVVGTLLASGTVIFKWTKMQL